LGVKLGLGEIEFSLSKTAQAALAPYVRAFSANFVDFAICVSFSPDSVSKKLGKA
jgi:hypothetical protein